MLHGTDGVVDQIIYTSKQTEEGFASMLDEKWMGTIKGIEKC